MKVIANLNTRKILTTAFANGHTHDFPLFKYSRVGISKHIGVLDDVGYQGLMEVHTNSQTPFKKTQLHPLTQEQKASDQALSRKRILSERYRNRRKRFGLRFNLIAGIYNLDLEFKH